MKKYIEIRKEIKKLSALQINNKAQRKEVKFEGTRTMKPWEAAYAVQLRRSTLMHLFRAYAILKGFELPKPIHKEVNQKLVDSLVAKYYVEPIPIEE